MSQPSSTSKNPVGRPRKRALDDSNATPESSQVQTNPGTPTKRAKPTGSGKIKLKKGISGGKRTTRSVTQNDVETGDGGDGEEEEEGDDYIEAENIDTDKTPGPSTDRGPPTPSPAPSRRSAAVVEQTDAKGSQPTQSLMMPKMVFSGGICMQAEYCNWASSAEDLNSWKYRMTPIMASIFMVCKNLSTDQRRGIIQKTARHSFFSDVDLYGKCNTFLSHLQRKFQDCYRKKVVQYGEYFFATDAGIYWREYLEKVPNKFADNISRPSIADILRWSVAGKTFAGLELTLFHVVDAYKYVLPYLKTIPTDVEKEVSWLANDKDFSFASTLLVNFAADIHHYIIYEGPKSGSMDTAALQAAIDAREIKVLPEKYPLVDMEKITDESIPYTGRMKKHYASIYTNQGLMIDTTRHIYVPEALLQKPVHKLLHETPAELYGHGTEESPYTHYDAGPAQLRGQPKEKSNATGDGTDASQATEAGVPQTQTGENDDNASEYESDNEAFLEAPGVEYGRDDPGIQIGVSLKAPRDDKDKTEAVISEELLDSAQADVKKLVVEICETAFDKLDEEGLTYDPSRIAQAMHALVVCCSPPQTDPPTVPQIARHWAQGSIYHKVDVTIAAIKHEKAVFQTLVEAYSSKHKADEEMIKYLQEQTLALEATLAVNLDMLNGIREKKRLLKQRQEEAKVMQEKVDKSAKELSDESGSSSRVSSVGNNRRASDQGIRNPVFGSSSSSQNARTEAVRAAIRGSGNATSGFGFRKPNPPG